MGKLRPTTHRREKIVIYGNYKVGKSSCWADILITAWEKGYDGKFWLIDVDNTWDAMRPEYGEIEESGMLTVYEPYDLEASIKISREIASKAKHQDWIFIDMIDWFWEAAQEWYITRVHGEDPEDYFLDMRRAVKEAQADDRGHKAQFGGQEGTDWPFITKIYKQFETPLTMKCPANILSVTSERKLDANRGATREQIAQHKHVSAAAPVGQKGIGHRHNTVMRMTRRQSGLRQLTMVGDRLREHVWAEKIGSRTIDVNEPPRAFVRAYLRKVAGWTTSNK